MIMNTDENKPYESDGHWWQQAGERGEMGINLVQLMWRMKRKGLI